MQGVEWVCKDHVVLRELHFPFFSYVIAKWRGARSRTSRIADVTT